MNINERELATILAALRYWQYPNKNITELNDIATNGQAFEALDAFEIDELCEKINE